jgi:hypothetical protein
MQQLTQHFSLDDFTFSAEALRLAVDNSVPPDLLPNAAATCALLERIRLHLSDMSGREIPIKLTSGYRCLTVNRAIGSQDDSDHRKAMAADFKATAFGTPYQIASILSGMVDELGIGQLIHEYGAWVHVSTRQPDKVINRIITLSSGGPVVGIQKVAL